MVSVFVPSPLEYDPDMGSSGDIVYTRVLGQEIIILNSEEVAIALLEKRSQKYSDRPVFSIADLYVVLLQFHFYALSADKYMK